MKRGIFIVIEGTDGTGKATQAKLLSKRLQKAGHDVLELSFPRYDHPSGYFVSQYLNGKYGSADEVGPYVASYFFALDRYAAAKEIKQAISQGKIVLADRYTASNMAHQGAKIKSLTQKQEYFKWAEALEYEFFKIPRPDINFVLTVPAEIAQRLIDSKPKRSYTSKKRDIHESDLKHLKNAEKTYKQLCQTFPDSFIRIVCTKNRQLMSIASVNSLLYKQVDIFIKNMASPKVKKENSMQNNPYVNKDEYGVNHISANGYELLDKLVTDPSGDTYALRSSVDAQKIGAAMARLSRRKDDLRLILLDEFSMPTSDEDGVLRRVISQYGDDSVQQLSSIALVAEKSSNLLTKKIEWSRLASYLEQSTRYIYYDKKDSSGNYRYHRPEHFDNEVKSNYQNAMDALFDNYSVVVRKLEDYVVARDTTPQSERDLPWKAAVRAQACDVARDLLPAATESTVGIVLSPQALESMYFRLKADKLPEANKRAEELLKAGRAIVPMFLERADKTNRGLDTIEYLKSKDLSLLKIASEYGIVEHDKNPENFGAELVSYQPKNELDILADILFETSSLSRASVEAIINKATYEDKVKVMTAYIGERSNRRHKPGRALEQIHYKWDIVCDYGIFRDLQRHRMVDDLKWQKLNPYLGYEIPKLAKQAGLDENFKNSYELSKQLYEYLTAQGHSEESQYATLMGHNMRWSVTYNAREAFHIHELRTSPQGHPGYRLLINQMHDKLCEVHPIIGEAMKFVNQEDDPDLTRLEAERRAHSKSKSL